MTNDLRGMVLLPATCLAFSLVVVLGTTPLAGCAQKPSGPGADEQAQAQSADAGDSQDASGATEVQPASVWVMTKRTDHYSYEGEDSTYEISYEYDDQGNVVRTTSTDGVGDPFVQDYAYDEDGASLSWTVEGDEGETIKYVVEKDEAGRVIKQTSDTDTTEHTYDGQGRLTQTVFTGTLAWDEEEGESAGTTYQMVTTYDENGFPVMTKSIDGDDGDVSFTEFSYELGEDGMPVRATARQWTEDGEGTVYEGSEYVIEHELTYDENGNISRLTTKDGDYEYYVDFEYQLIENPAINAWISAWIKPL